MTDEEIQDVYDYLHENYEYKDGQLIHKLDLVNKRKKAGEALGSFSYHTESQPYIFTSLTVKNKRYRLKLIKLIWLYHHKEIPSRIYQTDKNPMNTKIENLENSSQSKIQHLSNLYKKFDQHKYTNKDGSLSYCVQTRCNGHTLRLGSYKTKEEAKNVYLDAKNMILEGLLTFDEIKSKIAIKYPQSTLNIISSSNYKGVTKRNNKFMAQININSKKVYLGLFETAEKASEAYIKAKNEKDT